MGTINSALSIATSALNANQSALNVVANNVANANTTGYTVETPNWQTNTPIEANGIQVGQGVTETGATSQRDLVLQARLDQQQQLASASGTRLTALDSVQALFTVDSGSSSSATAGDIGADVTSFFNSFSSLEASPTDNALRESVLSSASTLAGDISGAAKSLNAQRMGLDQEASGTVSQINALTQSIAQLNLQIKATPNSGNNTLIDQQQADIASLSKLIGINQITTENSGLSITTTSGQLLVSAGQNFPLTTGTSGGVTNFSLNGTDVTSQLASGGGQLGGYLTARDSDIPSVLNSLDQLAYGISTQVNALNNAGADLNGTQGTGTNASGASGNGTTPLYIFNQPTQVAGSAAAMSVTMTDPGQIAAASLGAGTGDNSNAIAMANLANSLFAGIQATSNFSVTQNLSSSAATNSSVTGSAQIVDSLGKTHQATITYTNQGVNSWSYSIALADTLTANTSVSGQVSYAFGAGETVDPSTNLTITGKNASGTAVPITVPTVTAGEAVGSAGPPATGYVAALQSAISAAGIVGVTVSNSGGVLTIAGATSTSGSVVADAAAGPNATGTLNFNASGQLTSPAANVTGISFSGLSDGAAALSLNWQLYNSGGGSNVTQTSAASAQTAQSQDGVSSGVSPSNFYSELVTNLGATVSEVQAENTAQTASVTQLQSQSNALSAVNLNDEAAAMQILETSYQAASQVFNMLNTVITSALNLGVQTAVA